MQPGAISKGFSQGITFKLWLERSHPTWDRAGSGWVANDRPSFQGKGRGCAHARGGIMIGLSRIAVISAQMPIHLSIHVAQSSRRVFHSTFLNQYINPFLVRRNVLCSNRFEKYWNNLKVMVSSVQHFLDKSVNSDSAKEEMRIQRFPNLFDKEMPYSTEHLLTPRGTGVL